MRDTTHTPIPPPRIRELHHRDDDGIDVRLLWSESDGAVSVAVFDSTTGDAFSVDVRDDDRALDVFAHPFAYAACRGIDTSGVDTAPVVRALGAAWPASR